MCRLCGDKDETIIHLINLCCRLELKEHKFRYNGVEKRINVEICKKLNFDSTIKWYVKKKKQKKNRFTLWEWDASNSLAFWKTNGLTDSGQETKHRDS